MPRYKSLLEQVKLKLKSYEILSELLEEIDDTDIIIPAGGYGKRMGIPNTPKPMIKLSNGETLIEHCIQFYKNCGFTNFKILTGYKADVIENYLKDREKKLGVKIEYSRDPEIKYVGRGKAIKNAIENGVINSKRRSILTFSDDFFWDRKLPIIHLIHHSSYRELYDVSATILTVPGTMYPFGTIKEEHGIVREFEEKPPITIITSTGPCVMEPEVYDIILERVDMDAQHPVELERVVYPYLAKKGKLAHYMYPDPKVWTPVNTIKELEIVNKRLKAGVA